MTTIRQLSLTDAPSIVTVDRQTGITYYLVRVTPKDHPTASGRAHMALGMFEGRRLRKPRELMCHATNAAEIGPEVLGVQVSVLPQCQPHDFWLG